MTHDCEILNFLGQIIKFIIVISQSSFFFFSILINICQKENVKKLEK
jgi:hypothetical protein